MRHSHPVLAGLLATAIVVAGCGGTSSDGSAGSMAPSGSTSADATDQASLAPPSSTASPQDAEVLSVVDAYIHERTMEGAPYYIDSSATDFVGYEDGILRQDDRAICRAKFSSKKDDYYLQFVLAKEMGRYVIRRVVLEKLNELPVSKTLYNRDALVL